MVGFLKHDKFKSMNVAFCLDEGRRFIANVSMYIHWLLIHIGLANPTDAFSLFHGERAIWGEPCPSIISLQCEILLPLL